jgi:hypothetical protein
MQWENSALTGEESGGAESSKSKYVIQVLGLKV